MNNFFTLWIKPGAKTHHNESSHRWNWLDILKVYLLNFFLFKIIIKKTTKQNKQTSKHKVTNKNNKKLTPSIVVNNFHIT